MNLIERNKLLSALKIVGDIIFSLIPPKECMTCQHYDITGNRCKLADITPPPEVLKAGCEAYVYDPTSPPF